MWRVASRPGARLVSPALRTSLSKRPLSTGKADGAFNVLAADQTNAAQKIFHKTCLVACAAAPVAVLLHPTPLSMPVDLVLAVGLPVHAHIGMSFVLTDYVKAAKPGGPVRMALAALTVLTTLGLIRLSVQGDGIIGTVKATWKGKEEEK